MNHNQYKNKVLIESRWHKEKYGIFWFNYENYILLKQNTKNISINDHQLRNVLQHLSK